jgi:hypothetical protein
MFPIPTPQEDGKCYYSRKNLTESPTATWAMGASPSLQKAYSRLPLLLTPTTPVALEEGFAATVTKDGKTDLGNGKDLGFSLVGGGIRSIDRLDEIR